MPPAADHRLVVYGTLAPGRANHDQLAGLDGRWREATVRGELFASGWGAALGYPGLVLDPDGATVEAQLFESKDLPAHWPRLDAFEGPGYRRVLTQAATDEGPVDAWIYELVPSARQPSERR